jgi:hypothetical protein
MVRSFDAPGVPHDRNNDRYSDTDGDFRQRGRARIGIQAQVGPAAAAAAATLSGRFVAIAKG